LDISPEAQKTDPKRALTKDLSRGGARFLTIEPVGVGENVKIRIVSDQNDEKTFEATVVREEGVTHDGAWRYEIAVEFESILSEIVVSHLKNGSHQQEEEQDEEGKRAREDTGKASSQEAKSR
jgi:hypothetical protein